MADRYRDAFPQHRAGDFYLLHFWISKFIIAIRNVSLGIDTGGKSWLEIHWGVIERVAELMSVYYNWINPIANEIINHSFVG